MVNAGFQPSTVWIWANKYTSLTWMIRGSYCPCSNCIFGSSLDSGLVFHPQECQLGRINFTGESQVSGEHMRKSCADSWLADPLPFKILWKMPGKCSLPNLPNSCTGPFSNHKIWSEEPSWQMKETVSSTNIFSGGWLRPRPFKIARGPGLLLNHHLRWPTGGKGGYIFPSSFSEAKGTANPPNLSHETTSWCNRDRFQSCGKRPTQRGFNGAIDTYTFRGKCPIIMGFFALFFGISQGGLHSPLYNKAGYGYFLQGGSVFFFLGGGP